MKIVRPYARLIYTGQISPLRYIEWCGRISHRSEEKQTGKSWERFIEEVVLKHGDWSIVEHATASVDMLVDRGITHELVRHRLFSFTQESTRFVRYFKEKEDDIVNPACFIYPKPEVECESCLSGNEVNCSIGMLHWPRSSWWHSTPDPNEDGMQCKYDPLWLEGIYDLEMIYKRLLSNGWRPQEARSVFPNALASRVVVTGNLRNWRHIFIMRTSQEAHPQMRQVMIPLLEDFKKIFPILFDDITPLQKQSEAMKRIR